MLHSRRVATTPRNHFLSTITPVLAAAVLLAGALPASAQTLLQARTTAALHIRSGPGTTHAVLATIPLGASVALAGCLPDYTWCVVTYAGVTGWSSARYLSVSGEVATGLVADFGPQLGLTPYDAGDRYRREGRADRADRNERAE